MNMAGRFTLRRSAVTEPEIVAEPSPAAPSWMAPNPESAKDKVPAESSNRCCPTSCSTPRSVCTGA
jgi:hypothetical protein